MAGTEFKMQPEKVLTINGVVVTTLGVGLYEHQGKYLMSFRTHDGGTSIFKDLTVDINSDGFRVWSNDKYEIVGDVKEKFSTIMPARTTILALGEEEPQVTEVGYSQFRIRLKREPDLLISIWDGHIRPTPDNVRGLWKRNILMAVLPEVYAEKPKSGKCSICGACFGCGGRCNCNR